MYNRVELYTSEIKECKLMHYKLYNCDITDIPIPEEWKPFQREYLPDDNPWKYMPDWLSHSTTLSEEVLIHFYIQKAGFELPFHTDDPAGGMCALNYLVQGDEPIVFEEGGPVYYKIGLMNIQKKHMVPAGKVDRILLRYSFLTTSFDTVEVELTKLLESRSSISYKDLNSLLIDMYGD